MHWEPLEKGQIWTAKSIYYIEDVNDLYATVLSLENGAVHYATINRDLFPDEDDKDQDKSIYDIPLSDDMERDIKKLIDGIFTLEVKVSFD